MERESRETQPSFVGFKGETDSRVRGELQVMPACQVEIYRAKTHRFTGRFKPLGGGQWAVVTLGLFKVMVSSHQTTLNF